ncbi:MAG: hypothetical protein IKJ43_04675 [Bacilli bacterium]|nr:hypothetical protein [Bacilli bacterium]
MKRMTYVDQQGNQINVNLERKKPMLKVLLFIGNILPIIIIGLIIFTVIQNKICINIYDSIKKATMTYLKDQGDVPNAEGENVTVNIGNLYSEQYLKSANTGDKMCTGTVKVTKYKDDYVYTLDVNKCNQCSVKKKYGGWSQEVSYYPAGNAIVDVIPYYNYYDREINSTEWSNYYDDSEIEDEVSEDYGIRLPQDMSKMPEIPKEGEIYTIENDTTYYYRYRDRSWKWYDIEGDYSDFSSERPDGYAEKDEDSEILSEWSEFSLNYPQEKSYRSISHETGYKYYYVNKKGEKVYYNNAKYTVSSEVDTNKYNNRDEESVTLYRYQDKKWRWYNGQKRKYSYYNSKQLEDYPIKDTGTEQIGRPSEWKEEQQTDAETLSYRIEEKKLMTRYRIKYEILSSLMLKKHLTKDKFEAKVKSSILEFSSREDKKIDVTYKFKYRVS